MRTLLAVVVILLFVVIAAVVGCWFTSLIWWWVVPDVFAGMVKQGLLPETITLVQAFKVDIFAYVIIASAVVSKSKD